MSHTVTVTRTTTSTTTSAIILNTGYLKTVPGLLKVAEVIVGILLFVLYNVYSNYFPLTKFDWSRAGTITGFLYFYLVVFACLVCSTCLLIACLFSLSTSSIIAKTLYEFVFHGIAFLLYLVALILFFVNDNNSHSQHPYSTAGALGLVMVILYLASTIFAYRSYRGA